MKKPTNPGFLLAVALQTLFTLTTLQAREWTSADGRTMTATFVGTIEQGDATIVIFTQNDGIRYQVPLAGLSEADQKYVTSGKAAKEAAANSPSGNPQSERAAKTEFETKITRNLVQLKNSRVGRVSPDEVGPHEFYAIYFSAAWCPPCRTFTPRLVEFYNQQKALHGDRFELIFVSSDRDAKSMETYITDYKMSWPAVDFRRIQSSSELNAFRGSGIPCLVLIDNQGKVLSHSYEGGKYVGPTKVMRDLESRLK